MSSLNSLIIEIEKEKEERKNFLKKEHDKSIIEIKNKFQSDLNILKSEIENEFKEEKEKRIKSYKLEKEFKLKMELLSIKERILEDIISKLKNDLINSSFEKRKIFYKKRLEEIDDISLVKRIISSEKNLNEAKDLFSNNNFEFLKKDLNIKDGFIIEGERFSFEISISSFIDSIIEKNKEKLYKLFD